MKRMIFGSALLICGGIGVLAAWLSKCLLWFISWRDVAGPFTAFLMLFLAGAALCIWELYLDYKKKQNNDKNERSGL